MREEEKKLPRIGYAVIDLLKYKEFLDSPEFITWGEDKWSEVFYHLQGEIPKVYERFNFLWERPQASCFYEGADYEEQKMKNFRRHTDKYWESFSKRVEFNYRMQLRIPVLYKHEVFWLLGMGNAQFIVPTAANVVDFVPLLDYSGITSTQLQEVKKLVTAENNEELSAMSVAGGLSRPEIVNKTTELNTGLDNLKSEMEDVKSGKHKEIEKLQKEIDEKMAELNNQKERLLAELESRMAEMEAQKTLMENQIFLLDAEIYSIRCMLGEVVDFVKLRSGNDAPTETPLVLMQKLRYLDEEMGKIASFYDIKFEQLHYFEELIQSREDVMNTFLPTQKCVCCVKLSKNGLRWVHSHEDYGNILGEYDVEHGGTIGILVRNGDNVYMGWTDDERIMVKENILYVPGSEIISEDEANHKYGKEDKITVSSRYFIFSILSGLFTETAQHKTILSLPKGTSLLRPGEYVIYTTLDGALEDNRFGELRDICKKVNNCIQKGDHIITVQSVRPEGKYQVYNNVRGIGDKNRTYDVHASDMTIYPINKVNWEDSKIAYKYIPDEAEIANYRRTHPNEPVPEHFEGHTYVEDKRTPEQTVQEILAGTYFRHTKIVSAEIEDVQTNYFISLPKSNYDYVYRCGTYRERLRDSYANFRVYDDEYINLEVLTSLEVEYLITTRKVEGQFIGGRAVDYSYFIPYLKKMYKWIKEREDKEYELINKHVRLDDFTDWQLLLQEWKISTGHHIIGPKYAREFAKTLINKTHNESFS